MMRARLSFRVLAAAAVILFVISFTVAWSLASAEQIDRRQASAFDNVIEQHARDSFDKPTGLISSNT
jgi:hypothetical protein